MDPETLKIVAKIIDACEVTCERCPIRGCDSLAMSPEDCKERLFRHYERDYDADMREMRGDRRQK